MASKRTDPQERDDLVKEIRIGGKYLELVQYWPQRVTRVDSLMVVTLLRAHEMASLWLTSFRVGLEEQLMQPARLIDLVGLKKLVLPVVVPGIPITIGIENRNYCPITLNLRLEGDEVS